MNLNLSDEQLNKVIGGAIVGAMTPETRDELIANAVAKLLEPAKDPYSTRKPLSPLQEAFNNAVALLANKIVREKLEADPAVRAQVEGVVSDGLKLALERDREKVVEQIARGVGAYLSFESR